MLYISVENTSSVSATQDMVSYEDIRCANIHCIINYFLMQLFTSSPASTATTSSNIITTATTTAAEVSTRPVPPTITSFPSPSQRTSIADASTSTPVIADASTSTPVIADASTSTPVIADASTSTPVIADASTSTSVIADASNPSLLNQPSSQPLVKVSSSISLPHPNVVPPDSESGGVGAGVGGGVAAAVVVVLAVSVLGVGLYVVWRRRNMSKVELQPVIANGGFGNPVYASEWGLYRQTFHRRSKIIIVT